MRLIIHTVGLLLAIAALSYAVRVLHPDAATLDAGLTRDDVQPGEIWVGDAYQLAGEPGGVIWVDIRPPEEFAKGSAPGAFNCWPRGGDPVGNTVFEIMSSDRFSPESTIVLFCASTQCGDSHQVKMEIDQMGKLPVLVLAGGWQEYRRYARRLGAE